MLQLHNLAFACYAWTYCRQPYLLLHSLLRDDCSRNISHSDADDTRKIKSMIYQSPRCGWHNLAATAFLLLPGHVRAVSVLLLSCSAAPLVCCWRRALAFMLCGFDTRDAMHACTITIICNMQDAKWKLWCLKMGGCPIYHILRYLRIIYLDR